MINGENKPELDPGTLAKTRVGMMLCVVVDVTILAAYLAKESQGAYAITTHNALLIALLHILLSCGNAPLQQFAMTWLYPLTACLTHIVFFGRHMFAAWVGTDWWARTIHDVYGQPSQETPLGEAIGVPAVGQSLWTVCVSFADIWLHVVVMWRVHFIRIVAFPAALRSSMRKYTAVDLTATCLLPVLIHNAVWLMFIDPASYYRIAPIDRYFYAAFIGSNSLIVMFTCVLMHADSIRETLDNRVVVLHVIGYGCVLVAFTSVMLFQYTYHGSAFFWSLARCLACMVWGQITLYYVYKRLQCGSTAADSRHANVSRWWWVLTVQYVMFEQLYLLCVGNDLRLIVPFEPQSGYAAIAVVIRAISGAVIPIGASQYMFATEGVGWARTPTHTNAWERWVVLFATRSLAVLFVLLSSLAGFVSPAMAPVLLMGTLLVQACLETWWLPPTVSNSSHE
jgi:hypothetical protein